MLTPAAWLSPWGFLQPPAIPWFLWGNALRPSTTQRWTPVLPLIRSPRVEQQSVASLNAGCSQGPWMTRADSAASRLTVLHSYPVQMQHRTVCPFVNKWGQQCLSQAWQGREQFPGTQRASGFPQPCRVKGQGMTHPLHARQLPSLPDEWCLFVTTERKTQPCASTTSARRGLPLLGARRQEAQHSLPDPAPHSLGALQRHWLQCKKGQGCLCLPPAGSALLHRNLK